MKKWFGLVQKSHVVRAITDFNHASKWSEEENKFCCTSTSANVFSRLSREAQTPQRETDYRDWLKDLNPFTLIVVVWWWKTPTDGGDMHTNDFAHMALRHTLQVLTSLIFCCFCHPSQSLRKAHPDTDTN